MFEKIIGLAPKRRVDKFSLDFDLMVDSETQEVRWCKLRLEDGDRWFLGPENLICGLVFVLEQDNFLYLGFDLQGLNLHGERPVERDLLHLILIFNSIDGVNKAWIKFRSGKKTIKERYIYYPDAGRGPQVYLRNLTEDSEWPR